MCDNINEETKDSNWKVASRLFFPTIEYAIILWK